MATGAGYARLQEEHAKALAASKGRLERWEEFLNDYESLQTRLQSLPDKLTHDIMVPFGRLAFAPGQLHRTNEVMVLLGDNWFAVRSASQAAAIARRRREDVSTLLESERKVYGDLAARLHFTEELQSSAEGFEETKEIREELDPQQEDQYPAGPKQRVQWQGKAPPPRRVAPWPRREVGVTKTEGGVAELWARLDELEREEEALEEQEARGRGVLAGGGRGRGTPVGGGGEEVEQAGGGGQLPDQPTRITFSHSRDSRQEEEEEVEETESTVKPLPVGAALYCSPADISRLAAPTQQAPPTSPSTASRSVTWDPSLAPRSEVKPRPQVPRPPTVPSQVPRPPTTPPHTAAGSLPAVAFSGRVVERSGAGSAPSAQDRPEKVSRFKASRHNK